MTVDDELTNARSQLRISQWYLKTTEAEYKAFRDAMDLTTHLTGKTPDIEALGLRAQNHFLGEIQRLRDEIRALKEKMGE